MKKVKFGFLCVGLLMAFTSCDLLGIEEEIEKEKKTPQAELIWQKPAGSNFTGPPPLIEDSIAYVADRYGLAKLMLEDGNEHWRTEIGEIRPKILGKMLSDDNNLYVRFEQSVNAYSKLDGVQRWSIALEDSPEDAELAPGTSLLTQSKSHLFAGTREKLLIINKELGVIEQNIIPEVPAETISDMRLNVPVIAQSNGEVVYLLTSFKSQDNEVVQGRVAAYNPDDGSLIWDQILPYRLRHIGSFMSPYLQMAIRDEQLIIATGPGVVSLDVQTGEQRWSTLFVEGRTGINIGGLLYLDGNYVYIQAADRILKLSAVDGLKKWGINSGGFIEHMFAVNTILYYGSSLPFDGLTIQAVSLETGNELYRISPPIDGILSGFTSAFDAVSEYLVNVGVANVYGYKLPLE